MAVPSSGAISMIGIRREIGTNNYSALNTYSNISLSSMSVGFTGTINTNNSSTNRPNGTTPHQMSEFYAYNHDEPASATYTSITFAYNGDSSAAACDEEEQTLTVYYDNSEEVDVDLQLWNSSDGNQGEKAAGGYYKYVFGTTGWAVNNDGEITEAFSCGRSERRLKYNIEFIGDSPMGIPMYHFNYKDESHGKGRFVGTMVDDLQRLGFEDSLFEQNGEIWVNYHKLDVPFESVTN
jgi:hypothetical protein